MAVGNVPYLDFQTIKRSYSIEEIMSMSGLPFKKDGKSFRCECPVHKGGKRGLVVTPDEADDKGDPGVFYCFGAKTGGDRVALLAHVRDSKPYALFKELHEKRPDKKEAEPKPRQENRTKNSVPEEKEDTRSGGRGFQPLPYLLPDHPAVRALGILPEIAKALGIGFAPRGYHREGVAVPVRKEDGQLVGYISVSDGGVKLPPQWKL